MVPKALKVDARSLLRRNNAPPVLVRPPRPRELQVDLGRVAREARLARAGHVRVIREIKGRASRRRRAEAQVMVSRDTVARVDDEEVIAEASR